MNRGTEHAIPPAEKGVQADKERVQKQGFNRFNFQRPHASNVDSETQIFQRIQVPNSTDRETTGTLLSATGTHLNKNTV